MIHGLLLGISITAAGHDVPDDVVNRSRIVLERSLAGVDAEIRLEMFRTREAMDRAVRKVDPRAPSAFAAYYHYKSKTVYAYMAPRPEPALFRDRLPGILVGALVHEAQHVRGALTVSGYRGRPLWKIEGEADRDAVAQLKGPLRGLPGAGAWELMLRDRWSRGRGLFVSSDAFERIDPKALDPSQRATWYTQAWFHASGDPPRDVHDILRTRGFVDPISRGWRIVSEPRRSAFVLLTGSSVSDIDVKPLAVGRGQIDLIFDVAGDDYSKVSFLRRGGVRVLHRRNGRWSKEALHSAPPMVAGRVRNLSLSGGVLRIDGRVVLYLQAKTASILGFGVHDGAADLFRPRPAP